MSVDRRQDVLAVDVPGVESIELAAALEAADLRETMSATAAKSAVKSTEVKEMLVQIKEEVGLTPTSQIKYLNSKWGQAGPISIFYFRCLRFDF